MHGENIESHKYIPLKQSKLSELSHLEY
jgi:hypothetical protein